VLGKGEKERKREKEKFYLSEGRLSPLAMVDLRGSELYFTAWESDLRSGSPDEKVESKSVDCLYWAMARFSFGCSEKLSESASLMEILSGESSRPGG